MVLSRSFLLALLAAAGCGESLFDAHGKRDGGPPSGDGGPDGPPVPKTCPDECLGDAARDFDQPSPPWRYVEDEIGPSYLWMEMKPDGDGRSGNLSEANRIQRCRDNMAAPACQELPDALLVSTAGSPTTFFPALEFTAPNKQVLHLSVRAHVPGQSAEHRVRLYRNSFEDLLYAERVPPGATRERRVIVDALIGDRFLVALEPLEDGGTAAVQFFVSHLGETFPATCQLAVPFEAPSLNMVEDLCANRPLTGKNSAGVEIPPRIESMGPPYDKQDSHVEIATGAYLQGPEGLPLARSSALTIQFWARLNATQAGEGYVFSDLDEYGGGRAFSLFPVGLNTRFQVSAHTEITPTAKLGLLDGLFTAGSTSDVWGFVRIVETPDTIRVCINGAPAKDTNPPTELALASNRPQATLPLHLGRNAGLPTPEPFEGSIDDLRVFSEALPCDPP